MTENYTRTFPESVDVSGIESDITDLQNNKSDVGHTHTTADVTDLVAFTSLVVSGQDSIVASAPTSALTIEAGSNITLTTNAGTNTLTITGSGGGGGGPGFGQSLAINSLRI